MFALFTYLLFLFSYSYQLLIFYKLNQYRLGSIKDILKIIIILVISIITLDFIIGQAIFLILVIFFYSKKSQLSKIVSTILFANLITYAADLFIRFGEINAYIFQNGKTFTFEIRNKIKNIPQLSKIDMNPEIRTRISRFLLCLNYLSKTKLTFTIIGNIIINPYLN